MRPTWKRHRLCCVHEDCASNSRVLYDHRIGAKDCLLTTSAAQWATIQVGFGRTALEVVKGLNCDWHTANDVDTA